MLTVHFVRADVRIARALLRDVFDVCPTLKEIEWDHGGQSNVGKERLSTVLKRGGVLWARVRDVDTWKWAW